MTFNLLQQTPVRRDASRVVELAGMLSEDKRFYAKHREAEIERAARYTREHLEQVNATRRLHYANNKAKYAAKAAKLYRENAEYRAKAIARRMARYERTGE